MPTYFVRNLTFRLLVPPPIDIVSHGEHWRLQLGPSDCCLLLRTDGPATEYLVAAAGSQSHAMHALTVTGIEIPSDVLPARIFDTLVRCGRAERLSEPLRIPFRGQDVNAAG